MNILKITAAAIYKKAGKIKILTTVMGYIYIKISLIFGKSSIKAALSNETAFNIESNNEELKPAANNVKIAFICDEMTWRNFKTECRAIFITPKKWKKILLKSKPDILFCESAWSGIEKYKNCWRGQIYKNNKFLFENRRILFKIIGYCNKNGIPTVFWNKEDPVYFDGPEYNFSDTASRFDCVLTTAEECVESYKKLGNNNVHTLMFGYSPYIFYPAENDEKENTAVFAGSWYADQEGRCRDLERIFDKIINENIELQIYDRQSKAPGPDNIFPQKYQKYIKNKVTYEQLGDIFRKVKYAININTVKNSETMFARRVFEAMACGCIIISNHSDGLKNIFQNRIWFINEDFDHEREEDIIKQNERYVSENHTYAGRLKEILNYIK